MKIHIISLLTAGFVLVSPIGRSVQLHTELVLEVKKFSTQYFFYNTKLGYEESSTQPTNYKLL